MGVIASWNKDYETAKSHYEAAQNGGISENYNLGILKIREGDYDGALRLFGGKTCTFNVALANLLKGDYTAATNNLKCTDPQNAAVYYLMAVVGARSGNTTMMYDNLKKAVAEDASWKAVAKEDREFLKYFDNTDFQNIVK